VENAVAALRQVSNHPIAAAVGPCAGVCCYEVSSEVLTAFSPAACFEDRMLDLGATAENRLNRAGVNVVHRLSLCTICDGEGRFFSHRRDGVPTGRQGVIAWLNS
jgi:copper oxidase (laccase) domain-containing protein